MQVDRNVNTLHDVPEAAEVHVWHASLSQCHESSFDWKRVLSADEIARSQRFRFRRHQNAFLISRGLLRRILGSYLTGNPAELRFVYNRYGKPSLAADIFHRDVRFNVTHSGDLLLYAVAVGRDPGIDTELVRELPDILEMATRNFSPREARILAQLPASQRPRAFYSCWTQKEACLKARGVGLAFPLHQVEVMVDPNDAPELLACEFDRNPESWTLTELTIRSEYVSTLAIRCSDVRVTQFDACDHDTGFI